MTLGSRTSARSVSVVVAFVSTVGRKARRGLGSSIGILALASFAAVAAQTDAAPSSDREAQWKIVYEHYDERIGEGGTGLDLVTSSRARPVALVRRARGSEDNYSFPRFSPDGRFIAFSAEIDAEEGLYVMRADGTARTRVSDGRIVDFAWSPDGERLAFVTQCDPYAPSDGFRGCADGRIDVVARDGAPTHTIARPTRGRARSMIQLQDWSPEGTDLLYILEDPVRDRMYSVSIRGGLPRLLADSRTEGHLGRSSWSPDGGLIAYKRGCRETRLVDVYCDLAIMRAAGSAKRILRKKRQHLHPSGPIDDAATWIPGSSYILVADYGRVSRIFRIDARTGRSKLLFRESWNSIRVARDGRVMGGLNDGLVLARPDGSLLRRRMLPSRVDCSFEPGCDLWIR